MHSRNPAKPLSHTPVTEIFHSSEDLEWLSACAHSSATDRDPSRPSHTAASGRAGLPGRPGSMMEGENGVDVAGAQEHHAQLIADEDTTSDQDSLLEQDEELGIAEDTGESDDGSDAFSAPGEYEPVLGVDVEPSPAIFTSEGFRRIFIVDEIVKARGVHRPSFEFYGYIIELSESIPLRLPQTDSDTSSEETSGRPSAAGTRVLESGLTLSLRYEPPSPKFHSKCPGFTSYRLKVTRGMEFLYAMRGLPQQMWVDRSALVAVWGRLELAFGSSPQLMHFLETLKHVTVEEASLLHGSALSYYAGQRLEPEVDDSWSQSETYYSAEPSRAASKTLPPVVPPAAEAAKALRPFDFLAYLDEAVPGGSYLLVATLAAAAGMAMGVLWRK